MCFSLLLFSFFFSIYFLSSFFEEVEGVGVVKNGEGGTSECSAPYGGFFLTADFLNIFLWG